MVGTLTVGLGMFAVVYTVVQKVLIDADAVSGIRTICITSGATTAPIFDLKRGWLGGTDVAELQKAGGVIEDARRLSGSWRPSRLAKAPTRREIAVMVDVAEPVRAARRAARARPRLRAEAKRARAGRPSIVLTHELWNRLGADPAIVGTEVRLNGQPYTVIGVHAAGLRVRAQREPRAAAARRRLHHVRRGSRGDRIRTPGPTPAWFARAAARRRRRSPPRSARSAGPSTRATSRAAG